MCALIFGHRFPQALNEMIETADGRPVHGIYLCEERPRRRIFDFFDDLAAATGGSVRCFVLVRSGAQSELCPVHCDRGLVFQRSNKEITRVSVRNRLFFLFYTFVLTSHCKVAWTNNYFFNFRSFWWKLLMYRCWYLIFLNTLANNFPVSWKWHLLVLVSQLLLRRWCLSFNSTINRFRLSRTLV